MDDSTRNLVRAALMVSLAKHKPKGLKITDFITYLDSITTDSPLMLTISATVRHQISTPLATGIQHVMQRHGDVVDQLISFCDKLESKRVVREGKLKIRMEELQQELAQAQQEMCRANLEIDALHSKLVEQAGKKPKSKPLRAPKAHAAASGRKVQDLLTDGDPYIRDTVEFLFLAQELISRSGYQNPLSDDPSATESTLPPTARTVHGSTILSAIQALIPRLIAALQARCMSGRREVDARARRVVLEKRELSSDESDLVSSSSELEKNDDHLIWMQRVEQGLEALEHVLPKLISFAQTSFDGFTDGHREHITLLFMSIIPDLTDLISLIGMLVNDCKVINEMQANESEHKETPSHPDPRLRLASLILILVRGNPQLTRAALLAATHQCTKLASHLPSPAPLPTYFASPPSSSTETSPTIPSDWGVLCAANENYKARACIDSAYFCLHIIERIIATSTIDDLVISPLSSSQASRESQDLLDVFTPPTSTNNQDQPPDSKDTISQQLQSHIAHLLDASLNVYGAPPEYTEWVFRICLKLEGDRVRGQAWQRMEECVGSSQSKGDILE